LKGTLGGEGRIVEADETAVGKIKRKRGCQGKQQRKGGCQWLQTMCEVKILHFYLSSIIQFCFDRLISFRMASEKQGIFVHLLLKTGQHIHCKRICTTMSTKPQSYKLIAGEVY